MTFYRVRNSKTGREYTVARVADDETVLKNEPAVGRSGKPLPGKDIEKKASASKPAAKKAAAKKAAASKSTESKAEKEATK